jgi:hypothetical protein
MPPAPFTAAEVAALDRQDLRESLIIAIAGGVASQHSGFNVDDGKSALRAERFADETIRFTDALMARLDRENAPKSPEEPAS